MAPTRTVHGHPRGHAAGRRRRVLAAILGATLLPMFFTPVPAGAAPGQPKGLWQRVEGRPAATKGGHRADVNAKRVAAYTLDRAGMKALLGTAPRGNAGQRTAGAPLVLSLPTPAGDFQRFALTESSVMEPGLAARHPEIKTYAGKGLDDVTGPPTTPPWSPSRPP